MFFLIFLVVYVSMIFENYHSKNNIKLIVFFYGICLFFVFIKLLTAILLTFKLNEFNFDSNVCSINLCAALIS